MDIVLPLLLQVVLIFLNAIFACAEIAVISMNEAKLNKLVSEGNKKAKALQRLSENPSQFLSTIQIAITLSGFLGSAFAAGNFAEMLTNWLLAIGIANEGNVGIYDSISVIFITLILSYFTLVFGELIPKRIGMRKSEGIALALAIPLNFISKIFKPIVWFLTISINCVLKIIGIDPNQSDGDEGEENIIMMADMSSEKGLIDKEEQQMIRNVFEFDDLSVGEFDTHRTEVEFLWDSDNIDEWDKIIKGSFHKFYPICGESADDIIGVLNIREYFKLVDRTKENVMKKCVNPAYFIPETLKADVLFKQLKKTKNQFAIVLDEYGGVEGVVTIDDILEQLVGDFNDTEKTLETKQVDKQSWEISGVATIEEINNIFDTNFLTDEYDTFNGLVFSHLGEVPDDNSTFNISIGDLHIQVLEIREHKIQKAIVKKTYN